MIAIPDIIAAVCREYRVSEAQILGARRTIEIARPRFVICYLAAEVFGHALPTIGRAINRHHTTVLHGRKKVKKWLAQSDFYVRGERLQRTIDKVTRKLLRMEDKAEMAEAAE